MKEKQEHALLSASTSFRWLKCTPSARLEYDLEDTKSEYAAEGSEAHELAEIILKRWLARNITQDLEQCEICRNKRREFFQKSVYRHKDGYMDMDTHIEKYVNQAIDIINSYKDLGIFVETRLDYSEWAEEGFGTADLLIITKDTIHIVDLKYSKWNRIEAKNNSQLRLYALGAWYHWQQVCDIKKVKMTIIQPRLNESSTEELTLGDLLEWGKSIKPAADLAFNGEGEFKPSKETCRFCRAAGQCKAQAEHAMQIARREFAAMPNKEDVLMGPLEITELLKELDGIEQWCADLRRYTLEAARDRGVKFPGFKLVLGRSGNSKWRDEKAVWDVLTKAGLSNEEIIKPPELRGITEFKKRFGKEFDNILGPHVITPPGSPKLVPVEDKRQEWNSALEDFKDETD
jgi:hypothetical protein